MDFDATSIEPVFQPIVDLRDGSVVGYEALARGRNGNGPASPGELFAAARELGRVSEKSIELISLNPEYPAREILRAQVLWMGRILWASQ